MWLQTFLAAAAVLLLGSSIGEAANEIMSDSLLCSNVTAEKFKKMTLKEKSRELQKLQAANTSALLMMNFMSEYVNWDEFLYDLPVMVTELGKLMLYSNKRDFALYKDGVQFRFIKHPQSFRATLVQLAHTEWNALHSSHHNMDTIRLNSISVPGIFNLIFRIIARKKNEHSQRQLNMQLDRVLNLARQNVGVCKDSISKIGAAIDLINELQEATISAQSQQKDRLNQIRKEKEELDQRMKASAKQLNAVNEELGRQLETVKKFENDYKHAQKEAKPRMGEILGCALFDVIKMVPQMFLSSKIFGGSGYSGGTSSFEKGGDQTTPQADNNAGKKMEEIQGAQSVASSIAMILELDRLGNNTFSEIDGLIAKVNYFEFFGGIKSKFSSLINDIKSALSSFAGLSDEKKAQLKEELQGIIKRLENEAAAALAENASNGNSLMLNEKLDQIGSSNMGGTYGTVMSARLAQLKAATEVLINANQQHERIFNKKLDVMREHDDYFSKIAVIDFTEIDFQSILEVMREGILSLGRHIEHWKRFLEFFKIIEKLTELASRRTELFVNGTLIGVETGALMGIYENDEIYMDMLYEHSFVTIDISRALHGMTSTYVRVSNAHVFPHLNGITKLLAIEDPNQINEEFKKLKLNTEIASKQFKEELKADYLQQRELVKKRVHEMSCYMKLLSEDPDVKTALEDAKKAVVVPDF